MKSKALTINIVNIRARNVRMHYDKRAHERYMSYNHIFSIGYIKTDQHIHYRRQNNLQTFPFKKYEATKSDYYDEKAKNPGGGCCLTL